MIKKVLPISVFVLFFVVIVLLGLQNMLNNNKVQQTSPIKPTLYQGKTGIFLPQQKNNFSNDVSAMITPMTGDQLRRILPVFAPDFSLGYSDKMQKYVVTTQTNEGESVYNEWLAQNPSYINELKNTIVTKQTIKELDFALDYAKKNELTPEKKAQQDVKIFTDTLNILMNIPFLFMQSSSSPIETPNGEESPTPAIQTLNPTSQPTPSHYPLVTNRSFTQYS